MKRFLAILFSGIIILAGMRISYSAHYCHGNKAATKWSFSGKLATCGMEDNTASCPIGKNEVTSNCCSDLISFFHVDHNYKSSPVILCETIKKSVEAYKIQLINNSIQAYFPQNLNHYSSPPRFNYIAGNEVRLSELCVFRI